MLYNRKGIIQWFENFTYKIYLLSTIIVYKIFITCEKFPKMLMQEKTDTLFVLNFLKA